MEQYKAGHTNEVKYAENSALDAILTPLLENRIMQGEASPGIMEIERLRQIAINCDRKQMTIQEFANSITLEFLKLRLPMSVLQEISLDQMARMISVTLTTTPLPKARMQELWKYLLES